jgi:hypothetical protein
MKSEILRITFFILSITTCHAQPFKLCIEAGISIANTLTDPGITYFSNPQTVNNNRLAIRAGVALRSDLGKKSAFQTGLYYAAKGNKNIVPGGLTISYNSFELPISLVYMANKNSKINFWFGGGGYTAYVVNARLNYIDMHSKEVSEKARFGAIKYVDDLRRFEYGAQIQSGLSLKNGMFIRLLAQRQLNNLAPKKMPDPNAQYPSTLRPNSNFEILRNELYASFTVGYLIGFKKANKTITK